MSRRVIIIIITIIITIIISDTYIALILYSSLALYNKCVLRYFSKEDIEKFEWSLRLHGREFQKMAATENTLRP